MEVDAIEPAVIRQIVETCITRHIEVDRLQRLRLVEQAESETLLKFTGLDGHTLGQLADACRAAN